MKPISFPILSVFRAFRPSGGWMGIVATFLCLLVTSLQGNGQSAIQTLMSAVEERHNAAEKVYETAFKLANDYHTEVTSSNDAFFYSAGGVGTSTPHVGYKDQVAGKQPTYHFDYVKGHFGDALPMIVWGYVTDSDPAVTAQAAQNAANRRQDAITPLQNLVNSTSALEYPSSQDLPTGSYSCYDRQKLHKARWEWWVAARKTMIETGQVVDDFDKDIGDYVSQMEAHPDNADRNAAARAIWNDKRERDLAMYQRQLAACQAPIQAFSSGTAYQAAIDAYDDAFSAWNDDATAWFKQKQQDAADDYLDEVESTQTDLPVLYNSASVRKAAEKFEYLVRMPGHDTTESFWPCGASFEAADLVWTYPNPQTMEQQIATLNEISKHLVRLSGFYFSEGDFATSDVDPNPLLFSHKPLEFMPSPGIVTIDNYQGRILEICDRLKSMNRLIWPMLNKPFELNRLNEPSSLSGGTKSLDFGEGATVMHLARRAYEGPYTPYHVPRISFSSYWIKNSDSGAFLPAETPLSPVPAPRWRYSSGGAEDFRTITSTSYPLKLITKVGSRNVLDFPTALDGWRSKNRGVFQGSSSFVGDEKVAFTAEMGVVGSAFQADPSDDPWEITRKRADHLAKHLEIRWKRSYPNGAGKVGLLEQFNIPFEFTSIGQDDYDVECKAPFLQYLPSENFGNYWTANVGGTAFLSCEPGFSVQVPEPSRLMSPGAAEPFVAPIDNTYSLVFPLSYHERQGDVSPRLVLSLAGLGGVPSYTAGSVEFMKQQHPVGGLWGCMSILGSRDGIKVQRGSVPSVTGYLASDGSSYSPVTFPEYILGGERLAVPVSQIDFLGGKIEIEWTSPHHFELKYFVGTSATPHNTYEVSVGGVSAGQVVELWGTATYPSGFETVTINKNNDLWAKVISLGDGSPQANPSDDARVRVEYYDGSGQVEKRISTWSGYDPIAAGEVLFSKIAIAGEDPVDSISKIDAGYFFGRVGYDMISYGNRSISTTEFILPFIGSATYKLPDQLSYETGQYWFFDPELPEQQWRHLPLFREPETLDFSGSGWSRDGEQMVFNQGGLLTEHTYKVAGLDMESNVALSGNVVNRGTSVEGTSFSTSSETYSDELSRVTRVAGGVETTVEYYSAAGSAVPWSVKSISDPTGTRSYSYAKNGNGDLTVTETLDPNGSDPNTVSTTVLNAFGMLVSKEVKHGGITIASASASGHSSNPFQRPTSVTFTAGGVTRTQSLQYHPDGSLKKLNYGDGRVDDFEWDVLGRINTGSKIDSRNLTPSYNGFSNSFTLGDETVASETDAYGKLQELTSTVGAGLSVTKGSGDVFTSTITGENRGFEQTLLPDGFPSVIGGGAGSPGTGISYSADTVNGTHCIAVTSTVLASGEGTQVTQKSYYDGYGRLRRVEQPHPMGTGTVNTDYAYDMGARTVTITPPSPAKPILIEYDAGWKNAVITQGGTEIEVLSSAVAGTVTRIVKNGGREIFSSESSLATGEVVSKVNGRNAITSSPSSDGNTVSVTGPNGLDFEATYNRYGLSGMTGDVGGESFSTSVSRNGKGEIQTIALDPPGSQSATTFSFSEAGRLTGATGAGTNLGITYDFAGGGVKATGTDSASSTGFVVAEDAEGHPRESASTGRDALAMGGNALDGEVTLGATGFANPVTYTVGPTLQPLNKLRADGSGVSYVWHGDGSLASFTRFDGAGNGGGSNSFTLTTDPATGLSTGYTGTSSSLLIAPNTDGTIASAQYDSEDIDSQAQSYSVQYPSYFDESPLVETFGGALAGYEVKRNYNASTGETTRVELYKNATLVHAVDYTADGRSQIGTVAASGGKTFSATYGYPTGVTETVTAGSITATRTFLGDGTGRLSSVATSTTGGSYLAVYGFNGQRRDSVTLTSPSQPQTVWGYTFQNAVASTGQLQSATSSQGTSYTYNHDAAGNRAGSNPNPANQYTVVQVPGAQTYTVAGRVEPGATVTISRNGGAAEAVTTAPDGSFSVTYAAPAGGSSVLSIPIEVVGTLAGAGDNGTDAVAAQERTIVLAPANMATSYGAHGAISEDWRWAYRWDAEGRLLGMETRVGAVTAGMANVRIKFAYDDRGRRIGKTVQYKSADGLDTERTVTTKFVYDNWRLLAEEISDSAATGPVFRHYTWGKDLSGSLDGTGGVGGLLAIHQDGASYVPVYDGNGNITALVNAAGGAQVAFWSRGPFGEPISATGDTSLCPFGFATAYTDSETGLVYFGYRFYSPVSGRWLSREPLGEAESFNLYAYCHNDPVNKVDLLGLAEINIGQADQILVELALRYGLINEDAGPDAAIDTNILNACLIARGQVPIQIIGGRTGAPCIVCHGRGAAGALDGVSRLYSMVGGNIHSSSGNGDMMRKIGSGAWGNVRALGKDIGNSIAFVEYGIAQPIGELSGLWDWQHPSIAKMPFDADGSRRAGQQQVYPGISGDELLVGAGGSLADGVFLFAGPEAILKGSSLFSKVPGWSVRTVKGGLNPSNFGLKTIAEDSRLLGLWNDSLRGAASSGRANGYTRYLQAMERRDVVSSQMLEEAFGAVNSRFLTAARSAGYEIAEVHHWNFSKGLYPTQIVDSRHLVPTSSRAIHESLHRATTENMSNIWQGPIAPKHMIPIPDFSTTLAPF